MNSGNELWFKKLLSLIKKALDGKHDATIDVTKESVVRAASAADGDDEGEFVIDFVEGESVKEVE